MNADLERLLSLHDGVVTWADATGILSRRVVEWASARGHVARPFPGVLVDPERHDVGLRAALAYAGPEAALSHTSALALWNLPVGPFRAPVSAPVHVTTPPGRRMRAHGIVAHRRAGFVARPPMVVTRGGLPVTALPATLLDAWTVLAGDARRAPVIMAVSERMTTPERLAAALRARPNLPGRAELNQLLGLLAAGCRSALEVWGYQTVFTGPGFEGLRWQVPVTVNGRTVWLDALDEESRTNLELDGAAYHRSDADRERDIERDADLATIGIQAVRFSHKRLHREAEACRTQALHTFAIRRAERRRGF